MKTLERWLFSVFLFSLPFQARFVLFQWTHPFNEWTAGFLWATDILFVCLLIISNIKYQISKRDIFLFIFFAVAGISITQALIPATGWYRLIKLAEYIAIYFYVRQHKPPLLPVIFSGVFQGLIAIAQYIHQAHIGFRFLGESVLDPNGPGVAVVPAAGKLYLRAYGTFPHPNVLAAWLMLCLWAFAWWYLVKPRPLWTLLGGAVMLAAFYLTYSRVAIVLWLLGTLVICLLMRKRALVPLIATGTMVSLAFLFLCWPQVQSRLHIAAEDEAVAQRVFYAKLSAESSRHHALLGIGIGQFVPMLITSLPHYPRAIYQPAHNVYLLILNEIGIIGIIFFLLFLTFHLKSSFRVKPVFFILVTFLALGLFDHFFWTLQQGGLMFWGLLGAVAYGKLEYQEL